MLFYQSYTDSFTYSDIIKHISEQTSVEKNYHAENYRDYILSVITALVHNIDITLVDYRNQYKDSNPTLVQIPQLTIHSIDDLINRVSLSTSNIGIYSSGTTADPKLINQPVQRLMKSVRVSEDYTHSRWAFTYNPSHSAGIQVFLQALCNQATLYDLYKCSRTQIINTITEDGITHISATPTFYRMLAPYDFSLSGVKSVTFNGEKSTSDLINSIKAVSPNARVRNIYGSTESGPLMSSESTTFIIPKRLLGKVRIHDHELLIHSDMISQSAQTGEWYHTGDLVEVIQEEPLTIEFNTRKTRILNVGGQNVNPQEVEEMLLLHPMVRDVRVYGRKNKMIGNLVVAEVQALNKESVKEKDLINWCKEHLATYKVPRMIKLVSKIDVGRTGKKLL